MSPNQQRLIKTFQFSLDAAAVALATLPLVTSGREAYWLLMICWATGAYRLAVSLSHYGIRRPFWDELRELLSTVLMMAFMHVSLVSVTQPVMNPLQLSLAWFGALVALPLARNLSRQLLRKLGLWYQPLVLVGTGSNSRDALTAISQENSLGYRLVATVMPDTDGKWLHAHPEALVALALESEQTELLNQALRQLGAAGRDYLIVPSLRGLPLQGLTSFHTFSHEVLLLRARNQLKQLPALLMKRLFDYLGASLLLMTLSPLLVVLALLIRMDGGPILFYHPRVGRHGRGFLCPKLRTMAPDAETRLEALLAACPTSRKEWASHHKLRNDPRITRLGRFLRETSLDELPQLWSVIIGDMSLVGPRPVTEAELVHYGDQLNYYQQVLPGVTGLWQVSGRSDTDYSTRVALDVWYVKNWSLWTDVVILLKTIGVVLQRQGAR